MDLGIKGKIAFIGASSDGLGKATALELANEGVQVIICGRRAEKLKDARIEIKSATGIDPMVIQADLSNEQDRKKAISSVLEEYGKIDILVTNNGGPPPGEFMDFGKKDWDDAYEQLLASAVTLIRGFVPGMKDQKWGRIISVTSQAVKQPVENLVLSNAVRASVVGLTKTLASEFGPYNITVNNVMPGFTQTTRLKSLIESNPDFENAANEVPLGRFGNPKEFGAAVAFLVSERASYITGVSLAIDGGWIKNIM